MIYRLLYDKNTFLHQHHMVSQSILLRVVLDAHVFRGFANVQSRQQSNIIQSHQF